MYLSTFQHRRDARDHPPYGLYLDPHHGAHSWILIGTRALRLLSLAMATIVVLVVVIGPRFTS